jgi:hypothetical protein
MRLAPGRGFGGIGTLLLLIAGSLAALAPLLYGRGASAEDVRAAIEKANLYIEVARGTERAVDSWDRYASWVNLKTGPTGKERYLSYGMYELHDIAALLLEARRVAGLEPGRPKLDAAMKRYIDAYEALAPVMNRANDYYERKRYQADGMAAGRQLHSLMVPLVETFLARREAMLVDLRAFVRDVQLQEMQAIDAREGRSRAWHAAQVMHAAHRVVDLFPRVRPTPMNFEALEEEMKALGPDTPAAKFDEIISGVVRPTGILIDMERFDAAMKVYAEAVETFDRFAAEKPDGLKDFKEMPRHFLNALRALQEPLSRSRGRAFDGSDPVVGRVVQGYFEMMSQSSSISNSPLRFLP